MPVNRRITKFIPLALAAVAVAAPAGFAAQPVGVAGQPATGAQPVGARVDPGRLCTTINERGYPNAVPPILTPPPCSALVAIDRQEAFEGREFWSDPPATARYSKADMNAYASKSK
jgi:hypothetical protein